MSVPIFLELERNIPIWYQQAIQAAGKMMGFSDTEERSQSENAEYAENLPTIRSYANVQPYGNISMTLLPLVHYRVVDTLVNIPYSI